MPELTIEVGTVATDISPITRYTGEEFVLVLAFHDRESGVPLDVSGATITMALGSIAKADTTFTKSYGGDTSKVSVDITSADTANEGTYTGQVTAVIDDTHTVKSHFIRLVLISGAAALTLEDLRTALWDSATLSDLYNEAEFPDALLMQARRQAIDEWNTQPGRHAQYTVGNFPAKWVGAWRKGAIGEALLMKARNYAGNRMTTSAAGISIDETGDRIKYYTELAQQLRLEWITFIRSQQYFDGIAAGGYKLTRG